MKAKYTETIERARVLCEALPYISKYAGKNIVIKYGGNAMNDNAIIRTILQDIATLRVVGANPILVHGGGPEINRMLGRLEIKPQYISGLRVTDAATMEVVQMILCGKVNKNIAAELNTLGVKAIGLSGKDANLIVAKQKSEKLGYVGDIVRVNSDLINLIVKDGFVPVIATIGTDDKGNSYNINADTAAAEIAVATDSVKMMMLTDTDGILEDENQPESLIRRISAADLEKMINDGKLTGGMIPKAQSCIHATTLGVNSVQVINGTTPHSILLELFTDDGVGTLIEK